MEEKEVNEICNTYLLHRALKIMIKNKFSPWKILSNYGLKIEK